MRFYNSKATRIKLALLEEAREALYDGNIYVIDQNLSHLSAVILNIFGVEQPEFLESDNIKL